ncbi:MAG: hypothetical protein P8M72_11265 [Gammaproteobacteria bacterium]|nr:hypothetical protein [Gammaproteobacteria bacterium]
MPATWGEFSDPSCEDCCCPCSPCWPCWLEGLELLLGLLELELLLTVGKLGELLDELEEGLGRLGEELGELLGEELGELEELGMLGILEEDDEELDVDSQPATVNSEMLTSKHLKFLSMLFI